MELENFIKGLKTNSKLEENIYYNKDVNRFFKVISVNDDSFLCGYFKEYYEDAQETNQTQKLSWDFIDNSVKVKNLDEHPEFWNFNGLGWKVKK